MCNDGRTAAKSALLQAIQKSKQQQVDVKYGAQVQQGSLQEAAAAADAL
jgi:hypothetical protein